MLTKFFVVRSHNSPEPHSRSKSQSHNNLELPLDTMSRPSEPENVTFQKKYSENDVAADSAKNTIAESGARRYGTQQQQHEELCVDLKRKGVPLNFFTENDLFLQREINHPAWTNSLSECLTTNQLMTTVTLMAPREKVRVQMPKIEYPKPLTVPKAIPRQTSPKPEPVSKEEIVILEAQPKEKIKKRKIKRPIKGNKKLLPPIPSSGHATEMAYRIIETGLDVELF